MKPRPRRRVRAKKKGTLWIHHEGILSKRAFGFSGGCETDDRGFSNHARLSPSA
jgi:hypothetical protein